MVRVVRHEKLNSQVKFKALKTSLKQFRKDSREVSFKNRNLIFPLA
jgi:hypothetical protein